MKSIFSAARPSSRDDVIEVRHAYANDKNPGKVDLGIGAYRSEEGKPWVLPVVRKVEEDLGKDKSSDHEYRLFLGNESFREAATRMLLGDKITNALGDRVFGVQSQGGTGALRIGTEFLSRILEIRTVYISNPTWENHRPVFTMGGFLDVREYKYWDPVTRGLDFDGMIGDLKQAPAGSVVILHACAHNPTGSDPTREQWEKIADVMQERKLFTFFDIAYQGFATGDLDRDAWPVRYFVERGFELFCAQSFSKNAGLYDERIGNLTVVMNETSAQANMKVHLMIIVRAMTLTATSHGMKIMNSIFQDPQYFDEWKNNIKTMSNRILAMRKALRKHLEDLKTPGTWEHITNHIGMFSFTGLTAAQVEYLRRERHIYLMRSGRLNICGLTPKNMAYVAQAIHDVIVQHPE